MDLKKHVIDTIKEWQVKIGYREGNLKLYYPGESLEELLGLNVESTRGNNGTDKEKCEQELKKALVVFCEEVTPLLGCIRVSGSFDRYCLDIPAKGCAYVAEQIPEPEFLKCFLAVITKPQNTMEQIRECFAEYARKRETSYVEEEIEEDNHVSENVCEKEKKHTHSGHAFYFQDVAVEEYVYWVEENEFGLNYHRFTREEYRNLR